MSKRTKSRQPFDRVSFALRLVRGGLPLDEAARRASVSPERLERALGTDDRPKDRRTKEKTT